jgi:hypothetical protein
VYPDYTLRLYKNGRAKFPQKDVHEQVVVNGKTGYLINPLIHMADRNLERYFLRFNRYTDLLSEDIKTRGSVSKIIRFIDYVLFKPIAWFFSAYFRHLGFLDSWQGLLFAFFSSLRFPVAYFKSVNKKL